MTTQLIALLGLIVTVIICLNADAVGARIGVMALPDEGRKRHAHPTPQVGGVAVMLGFTVWGVLRLLFVPTLDPLLMTVLLTASSLAVVGFVDDQRNVSPILRMLLLFVFLGVAFALDPALIATKLNWFSFESVAVPIWVYVPLMGLTAIGLVNSVNMADGQNGLVGSMFVSWTLCLMLVSTGEAATIASMLFALSLVFLIFNLRGKMFLGDCGSYGITFAIGLLCVMAHAQGQVSLETIIAWFFIPVMDCVRLLVTRPMQGRSPFDGGRDHFHHRLIDSLGMRPSAAVYIGAVVSSSLIATLYPRFALVVLCVLSAFYFSFARLSESLPALGVPRVPADEKIVSINNSRRKKV
jgi:UDP-GlcNAc:undecaprenyl-phosphate GlcNAc-1-phosphate transferase